MATLFIRNVPYEISEKLKEFSSQYGFPSLNSYLVHTLTKIVESEGLTQTELLIIESQNEVAKQLEKNTEAILMALEFLNGRRDKT